MILTLSVNNKQDKHQVPDNYTVYELFADMMSIPDTESREEIARKMRESKMGLKCSATGTSIAFKDFANSETTLAELGVTSDRVYDVVRSMEDDSRSG